MLTIFVKSILFTGLLGTDKANVINIGKGFFSVPSYLVYFSFVLLILSISFLFKGRSHLWLLIIIDIVATLLLLCDLWYYRSSTGFLNASLILKVWNIKVILKGILVLIKPIDLIFVIDILPIIVYVKHKKELHKGVNGSLSLFLLTLSVSIFYLTYVHIKIDILERSFYGQSVLLQSWAPTETMSNLGPIGYQIYDSYLLINNSY